MILQIRTHSTTFGHQDATQRCVPPTPFLPQRSMQSSTRMVVNKALHTGIRPYASHRVFTPIPKESSNQCLNNNEVMTFPRKNKTKTVLQHSEWLKDICIIPDSYGKNCNPTDSEKDSNNITGGMSTLSQIPAS